VEALDVQLYNILNRFVGRDRRWRKRWTGARINNFFHDQLLECYFAKNQNYCSHLTEVAEKQACSMRLKSSPSREAQYENPNPKQLVLQHAPIGAGTVYPRQIHKNVLH
jgi:hypothetical protein